MNERMEWWTREQMSKWAWDTFRLCGQGVGTDDPAERWPRLVSHTVLLWLVLLAAPFLEFSWFGWNRVSKYRDIHSTVRRKNSNIPRLLAKLSSSVSASGNSSGCCVDLTRSSFSALCDKGNESLSAHLTESSQSPSRDKCISWQVCWSSRQSSSKEINRLRSKLKKKQTHFNSQLQYLISVHETGICIENNLASWSGNTGIEHWFSGLLINCSLPSKKT